MEYLLLADYENFMAEKVQNEMLKELIELDFDLRTEMAEIRSAIKKGDTPRVPEGLKTVMEAENPLKMEIELAKIRWQVLECIFHSWIH